MPERFFQCKVREIETQNDHIVCMSATPMTLDKYFGVKRHFTPQQFNIHSIGITRTRVNRSSLNCLSEISLRGLRGGY